MKLRVSSLSAIALVSFFGLLALGCSAATTPSEPNDEDPAVAATIRQADDEGAPDDDSADTTTDEAEADYKIKCSRCGPGPQPWHSGAVKTRHRHHDD